LALTEKETQKGRITMSKLPPKPAAVDGANLRLYRMYVLTKYVEQVRGATLSRLQAYMTLKFGMRRRTTQELVGDMANAKILRMNGVKFEVTSDGEKWLEIVEKDGGS
jgi:hypothetical protein